MDYNKAKELLEKYGQEQLLRYYDELNDDRKASLLRQIEGIDFSLLDLIILWFCIQVITLDCIIIKNNLC